VLTQAVLHGLHFLTCSVCSPVLWVRYFSSAAHKGRLVTVSKEPNKTLSSHPKFISSQYWLIFLVPALFFSLVFFTLFKSTEVTPSQLSWHWIIEICPSLREALSSRRPQPEGWRWACRAPHRASPALYPAVTRTFTGLHHTGCHWPP